MLVRLKGEYSVNKQKSSLDIAKFICAILILVIHTNPFGSYSNLLSFGFRNIICVIAVPFFFCTSGYLLSEKLESFQDGVERNSYIKKYLKRLVVIYLFWSAVYFPFVVVKWLRAGFHYSFVVKYIKDFFFEGSYSTIWFLPALMSAAAIYWLLRKKLSNKRVFFVGCGFYVITLLLSSYYGITSRIPGLAQAGALYYSFFDSVKNGALFGLVFLAMGGMLREEQFFARFSRKQALIGIIVSYVLLSVEVMGYKLIGNARGVDTVATLLPLTVWAMLFAQSFALKPSKRCITLRKYSMLIFLCQRLPISVIDLFLSETVFATNTVVNCVTVTAATFLISFVIIHLSEKVHWLKKIY